MLAIKKIIYFFLFMLMMVLVSGCDDEESPTSNNNSPGPNEVFMQGNAFSPASLTISVGTTVKWVNREGMVHTVTSGTRGNPTGAFDSGNLGQNGEFSFTFDQAGTFSYFCLHHVGMDGTIIVQ